MWQLGYAANAALFLAYVAVSVAILGLGSPIEVGSSAQVGDRSALDLAARP